MGKIRRQVNFVRPEKVNEKPKKKAEIPPRLYGGIFFVYNSKKRTKSRKPLFHIMIFVASLISFLPSSSCSDFPPTQHHFLFRKLGGGSLGGLVGVDLLAIFVVPDSWGGSTVAATFSGTDTEGVELAGGGFLGDVGCTNRTIFPWMAQETQYCSFKYILGTVYSWKTEASEISPANVNKPTNPPPFLAVHISSQLRSQGPLAAATSAS